MKHIHAISKTPGKADDFTTGQKLTLAAGVIDAIASFLGTKEAPDDNDES